MKKNDRAAGMSLLETMIGLGLLALLLPMAYKLLTNSGQVAALSEDRLKLRAVARNMESFVDCSQIPQTCVPGQLISLPKKNGGILVAANEQNLLSGWRVRALCTSGSHFIVQAIKDNPITKQGMSWDDPKSTLFPEKTLCSSRPTASEASPGDQIEVKAGTSCLVTRKDQLPCNPPPPPPCDPGFASLGMSVDTFGGDDDPVELGVLGQRWMLYCRKINPT
jgi:type II secretory pathway pseudopilin PulG